MLASLVGLVLQCFVNPSCFAPVLVGLIFPKSE